MKVSSWSKSSTGQGMGIYWGYIFILLNHLFQKYSLCISGHSIDHIEVCQQPDFILRGRGETSGHTTNHRTHMT